MSTGFRRIGALIIAVFTEIVTSFLMFGSVDWSFVILAGIQGLIIYEIMSRTQSWLRWMTLPIYIVLYMVFRSFTGYVFHTVFSHSANFEYPWQFGYAFTDPYSIITASIVVLALFLLVSGKLHTSSWMSPSSH